MSAAKKQEKIQESIRKLALKPDNRICMDCDLKSTPNVVMDFGIFVCTFCSGIHRSYQFKAKGISMTNFKEEEAEFLAKWGNEKAKSVWRATCKLPLPKANDERAIKDFIRKTYVDKEWYKPAGSTVATDDEPPKVQPIQAIIDQPVPLEVKTRKVSNATQPPAPKPTPKPAPAPVPSNDIFDFDTPVTQVQPTKQVTQQPDDFDADFSAVPQTKQPAKKMNLDDLFGPSSGPAPAFGQPAPNPYGQPAFGQQPNPYGQPAPNPYGQQAPNPFGQPAPNPYGQQAPNPFGQPAPNPYGQQAPNPFGQQPNPYGQPAPNPYGQQAPNPFGQPAPNPYGQQAPNPFGQPAPYGQQPNPYGQQAPNPFGQPAPNAFGQPAPNPFGQPAPAPQKTTPAPTPAPAPTQAPAPQKDLFADLNVFGTVNNASKPAPIRPATNGFDDFGSGDWGAPKKAAPAANNNTMDFPF